MPEYRKRPDGTFLVPMKAKPGRPKKPKSQKMDQKVQVQLTSAQHRKLLRWADRADIQVPEAIRRFIDAGLET